MQDVGGAKIVNSTSVLRLLSSPTHVQGKGRAREETYELVGAFLPNTARCAFALLITLCIL